MPDTVQSRRFKPENDDDVALECLITGGGDVAFVSQDTVQKYKGIQIKFCSKIVNWISHIKTNNSNQ